jgi:uncharacterized protein YkwD
MPVKSHPKRFCAVLAAALLTSLVLPQVVAVARDPGDCWRYRTAERRFARKTNLARSSRGMPKLHLDRQLSRAARKHTREMVHRNRLHHTPTRKLSRRVTRWRSLGENVGVGGRVGSLNAAFMDSTPHRANVVNPTFRHFGIGTVRKRGKLWVTVIFESFTNPGTRLWMPPC